MKFLIDRKGNNFGDLFLSYIDSENQAITHESTSEGEHEFLCRQLKKYGVVAVYNPESIAQIKEGYHIKRLIQMKPIDEKLLKREYSQLGLSDKEKEIVKELLNIEHLAEKAISHINRI